MNNSKSGLVGIISFFALAIASVGLLGAASRSASAHAVSPAPVAVVRDAAPAVSFTTVLDEVTISASAPRPAVRRAAPAIRRAPHGSCSVRELGDGNGTSVRSCDDASML